MVPFPPPASRPIPNKRHTERTVTARHALSIRWCDLALKHGMHRVVVVVVVVVVMMTATTVMAIMLVF